jgi:hypothetical protein
MSRLPKQPIEVIFSGCTFWQSGGEADLADQPGESNPQPASFVADIRPLFTPTDISHMDWYCDLSSYEDVKSNAHDIERRLKGQGGAVMPPPPNKGGKGPWSAERIALFEAWIEGGCQP